MDLLPDVRRAIQRHRLLARGDRVVVAVSGGADSVALLDLLWALRVELDLSLHVAHLDHRLRPDSAGDAAFVRDLAGRYHLPVTIESADVRALAAAQRRSLEDAGRAARYAFFERVASRLGAAAVAVAHTADDQVETVAMRLVQGAAWEALAGMPAARPLGPVRVVRPLLDVARARVRAYLTARGASWREDPTNLDQRILRNWVRWTLLPALVRQVPEIPAILTALSALSRDADAVLTQTAARIAAAAAQDLPDGLALPKPVLATYPPALAQRMLRWAVAAVGGTPPPRADVERVGGRVGRAVAVAGCLVRTGYDAVEVVRAEVEPEPVEYELPVPGTVDAAAFGLSLSAERLVKRAVPEPVRTRADEVYVDAAAAGTTLRVRAWRPGDRVAILGLRGKRKVQDVFVDAKVPRWRRRRIPLVVTEDGDILWVVGVRLSERGRITPDTMEVVRLRARPMPRLDSVTQRSYRRATVTEG